MIRTFITRLMHKTPENSRVVYKDSAISTLKSAHKSENRSKRSLRAHYLEGRKPRKRFPVFVFSVFVKNSANFQSFVTKTAKTFSRFRIFGRNRFPFSKHENHENVFPFSQNLEKRFRVFAYFFNFAFSFSFLREKENENEHVFPFFVFVADPCFRLSCPFSLKFSHEVLRHLQASA